MYDYDACLIYDHLGRTAVNPVARRLTEEAHLVVVHCRRDLVSSDVYLEEVTRTLESCATAVVLLDAVFPELWSLAGLRPRLEVLAAAHKIRLIVVLLPGCKREPDLSIGTLVDYRQDSDAAFQALEAAIVGCSVPMITYNPAADIPDELQVDTSVSGVFLPAQHYEPRPAEMESLRAFWRDETQGGVLALNGIGGSGKTTLLMRFLQVLPQTGVNLPSLPKDRTLPHPLQLFLWSFYDNPNIEYFIRGLYERLTHRPTADPARDVVYKLIRFIEERNFARLLIVLDGLEIVQEDPGSPGGFGLLRDSSLRHFVRRIAQGDLAAKMIVTSRYPLPELTSFEGTGYRVVDTNQVDGAAARGLLRKRGVSGTNTQLDRLLERFGHHLLTLDHLGQLTHDYLDGDPERALALPDVADESSDPQAQRLMQVLAFYNKNLPEDELTVLRVLCILRRPITRSLLADFFEAPPEGWAKLNAVELRVVLAHLQDRGLITFYSATGDTICMVHPAVRAYFSATFDEDEKETHANLISPLFSLVERDEVAQGITNPKALDILEEAIYHAAASSELYDRDDVGPIIMDKGTAIHSPRYKAAALYEQLGGYQHFAWRLGDYQRGLRITTAMMKALGKDYLGWRTAPWHDHNLFLLDAGQPALAEEEARQLLQHYRDLLALDLEDEDWLERNAEFMVISRNNFSMYEQALVQTLCDALLAQGKLVEAREVIDDALSVERDWGPAANPRERHTGSNPYGRRAVALALMGEVQDALQDFEAADVFAREHTSFLMAPFPGFRPDNWYHIPFHASLLARLGHLRSARRRLEQLDYEYVKTSRPLSTAQIDLASSEIAYLSGDHPTAARHVELALGWAMQSGHQQTYARALIMQARFLVRSNAFQQAGAQLEAAEEVSRTSQFNIQLVDDLVVAGHLALETNDFQRAEALANEALATSEQVTYRWGMGDAAYLLARCAYQQEQHIAAMVYAEQALVLRETIQDARVLNTQELMKTIELQMQ